MTPLALITNDILTWATLILQIAIIVLVILLITKSTYVGNIRKYALPASFTIALLSVVLSLFYSEILGFPPCELCWYQRIALFPQVIILAIALIKKDIGVAIYTFVLSLIGIIIGIYQYILQKTAVTSFTCDITSAFGDCSKILVDGFGYITLPLMSVTAFTAIAVLTFTLLRTKKA